MQYEKCLQCIHNGNICKMVMAQAINLCFDLESTINYAQTRNTKHKCDLTINCVCKNFIQKDSKEAEYNV